ncbi:DUF998 domain-containing protein [Methanobacterium spitsbergense]|uniref:DUF998 domain-containing protein n=1 Tax=Methanobacterium spitsbergense TaxID=2874285 RepID=A0A8T5UW70_9EURY|nr:DUF998 domain-containing protein [Methanobacterium spitsbergense]MBZ2166517.1 DUF998 domain-containing protein [Methanobacterium spitsbergense]
MKFQRGSLFKPEHNHYKFAGTLLIVACIQYLIAVNISESMFPGNYSIALNSLSDLGGTIPLVDPSALIFNISNIILGILIVAAVYLILKSGGCRLFSSCLLIFGISIGLLGIFTEYTPAIHVTLEALAFIFGSLALLFSYRLGINIQMTVISIVLGLIALITFISPLIFGMGDNNPFGLYFGMGGSERLIIYPIILYLTALGGYLSSRGKDWVKLRFTEGYW